MIHVLRYYFNDAKNWCEGRWWFVRAPLIAFFIFIFIQHLRDPMYQSILKGLNLGIHELGHFVFMPFGELITFFGGTILQCAVPVISIFMFLHQRDYFAIAISFGWLSTNFFDVSTYVADANVRELPLVSPFGTDCTHDWYYILTRMSMQKWDMLLASTFRIGAIVCMLICFAWGSWTLFRMMRKP